MTGRLYHNATKERTLADQPALFREIFGGAEFPDQSVRKLLAAVALVEVKDYFLRPEQIKNPRARSRAARRKADADRYLFDPRYRPACPAFSFAVVCKTLGVDPGYARRGIREKTPDEIRAIIQRLTFHRASVGDEW
jgi:hypothetical protein